MQEGMKYIEGKGAYRIVDEVKNFLLNNKAII